MANAWGWQLLHHLWAECLNNVGSLTSHNPRRPPHSITGVALLYCTFTWSTIFHCPLQSFFKMFHQSFQQMMPCINVFDPMLTKEQNVHTFFFQIDQYIMCCLLIPVISFNIWTPKVWSLANTFEWFVNYPVLIVEGWPFHSSCKDSRPSLNLLYGSDTPVPDIHSLLCPFFNISDFQVAVFFNFIHT
jgi:hypothetical protein